MNAPRTLLLSAAIAVGTVGLAQAQDLLDPLRTEESIGDREDGGSQGRNSPDGTFDGPSRGIPEEQQTTQDFGQQDDACTADVNSCTPEQREAQGAPPPSRGIPEEQQTTQDFGQQDDACTGNVNSCTAEERAAQQQQ